MFNFLQSIFAKIATAITAVLASVGLISSPALPTDNAPVSVTTKGVVVEEIIAKPAAKPTSDPVAEELRQLQQEVANLKSDNSQLALAQKVKPESAPTSQPKTFITPSGAIVDEKGNLIAPPINTITAQSSQNQPANLSLSGSDIMKKVGPATIFVLTDTLSSISCGTGFIIDNTGFALTNAHVVERSENLKVSFANGIKTDAKLIGVDEVRDIALIKVSGSNLPFLDLGSSDPNSVSVGEDIFAIGYPGIADIATCSKGQELAIVGGIINARRVINAIEYFQIDALIQRGNSGGPLVNKFGQVVGINTSGYTNNAFSTGVNFALPINLAKGLLPGLQGGLRNLDPNKTPPLPPPAGLTIQIKRPIMVAVDFNPDKGCGQLGFFGKDLEVCELYRVRPNQYDWAVIE